MKNTTILALLTALVIVLVIITSSPTFDKESYQDKQMKILMKQSEEGISIAQEAIDIAKAIAKQRDSLARELYICKHK
jgi:hypothetical protein